MTVKEFNELSLEEKGEIWTENGIFIDERVVYNKGKIVIYALFNFYVEVHYDLKGNKIEALWALENEDWKEYFKSINLN